MYTDFRVSNAIAMTDASDANAGGPRATATGGPIYTPTTVTRVDATHLQDTSAAGWWEGCSFGDWIAAENGGAYTLHCITDFTSTAGPWDTITVSPELPAAVGAARVGGWFATLPAALARLAAIGSTEAISQAAAWRKLMDATPEFAMPAPRLCVQASGVDYSSDTNPSFDVAGDWEDASNRVVPLTIEGYVDVPGDAREGATRPRLTTGLPGTSLIILRLGEYCQAIALDVYHPGGAGSSATGVQLSAIGAGLRSCRVEVGANGTSAVYVVHMNSNRGYVIRNDLKRNTHGAGGTAAWCIYAQSTTAGIIRGNIIEGPSSAEQATNLGQQGGILYPSGAANGLNISKNVIFNHDAGIVIGAVVPYITDNTIGRCNRRNITWANGTPLGTTTSGAAVMDNILGDLTSGAGYSLGLDGTLANYPHFLPYCDGNAHHGIQLGAYHHARLQMPNFYDYVLPNAASFFESATSMRLGTTAALGVGVLRTLARAGASWSRETEQPGAFPPPLLVLGLRNLGPPGPNLG